MTKASEKTALRDWNKLDSKFWMEASVLTVMLNTCKVDRNQPAVPVNSNLLDLYETASSLELKADPWILFLYSISVISLMLVLIVALQSRFTPLPSQSKRGGNRVRISLPSTVSLELVGVGPSR